MEDVNRTAFATQPQRPSNEKQRKSTPDRHCIVRELRENCPTWNLYKIFLAIKVSSSFLGAEYP